MFCSNCGKQINEDDKFCPACGKSSAAESGAAPAPGVQGGVPPLEVSEGAAPAGQPSAPGAPVSGAGAAAGVQDYTAFSVLIAVFSFFLCCCFNPVSPLLGIVAIIISSYSRRKLREGDIAGALSDANTAKLLCWIAIALYGLIWAVRIILQLVGNHPIFDYDMMYDLQKKFGNTI